MKKTKSCIQRLKKISAKIYSFHLKYGGTKTNLVGQVGNFERCKILNTYISHIIPEYRVFLAALRDSR